jgi:NAD-dependent DNA ligase
MPRNVRFVAARFPAGRRSGFSRCIAADCPAQLIGRLPAFRFAARDADRRSGLSRSPSSLLEKKWLRDVADLYSLKLDDLWLRSNGWLRSPRRMSLVKSKRGKSRDLWHLVYGLGIVMSAKGRREFWRGTLVRWISSGRGDRGRARR